jgi:hypothetical protein
VATRGRPRCLRLSEGGRRGQCLEPGPLHNSRSMGVAHASCAACAEPLRSTATVPTSCAVYRPGHYRTLNVCLCQHSLRQRRQRLDTPRGIANRRIAAEGRVLAHTGLTVTLSTCRAARRASPGVVVRYQVRACPFALTRRSGPEAREPPRDSRASAIAPRGRDARGEAAVVQVLVCARCVERAERQVRQTDTG